MHAFVATPPLLLRLDPRAPLPTRRARIQPRRAFRPAHIPACTASQPPSSSDVSSPRASPAPPTSPTPQPTGSGLSLNVDGCDLSYDYFPGRGPVAVFLPSFFYSRWRQAKANALTIFAKRKGQAVLVAEYRGTGRSGGDFVRDGTLTRWVEDTEHLLRTVVPGEKLVLVGAGIGGWIMLHIARRMKNAVVGLVGVNPSIDFTEDLLLPSLSDEQKAIMESEGSVDLTWGFRSYSIGKNLVEDARKWLVLRGDSDSLDITCPIRLLQGMSDEELPPGRIIDLADKVSSDNVVVSFVKFGDHQLETDEDMHRMWKAVCEVSDMYYEYDLTSPSSG